MFVFRHKWLTMIVLIDNYDSFTYNIYQYLGEMGANTRVVRNNEITESEIFALNPKGIIISPGPCTPSESGISLNIVTACIENNTPLLGICLGHQCIGQALGGNIIKAAPMHGKVSHITHDNSTLFKTLPSPLPVTRYHSLIIEHESCPDDLIVTAKTDDNIIMAVQHKTAPVYGVQFHPESIATQGGHAILQNFIDTL